MKELQVIEGLKIVNFEEVKAELAQNLIDYPKVVVTEENLADMEKDVKALGGLVTKLEAYRKEKKQEAEKPIKEFEGKIKELVAMVEKAKGILKEQTDVFEEKRVAAKWENINTAIQYYAEKYALNEKYAAMIQKSDKWTNRTAKDSDIAKEIEQQVVNLKQQQTNAEQLEQARKDRAAMVTDYLSNNTDNQELYIPLDISDIRHIDIMCPWEEMKNAIAILIMERKDKQTKKEQRENVKVEQKEFVLPKQIGSQSKVKQYTMRFSLDSVQANKLKAFLESEKIEYIIL